MAPMDGTHIVERLGGIAIKVFRELGPVEHEAHGWAWANTEREREPLLRVHTTDPGRLLVYCRQGGRQACEL